MIVDDIYLEKRTIGIGDVIKDIYRSMRKNIWLFIGMILFIILMIVSVIGLPVIVIGSMIIVGAKKKEVQIINDRKIRSLINMNNHCYLISVLHILAIIYRDYVLPMNIEIKYNPLITMTQEFIDFINYKNVKTSRDKIQELALEIKRHCNDLFGLDNHFCSSPTGSFGDPLAVLIGYQDILNDFKLNDQKVYSIVASIDDALGINPGIVKSNRYKDKIILASLVGYAKHVVVAIPTDKGITEINDDVIKYNSNLFERYDCYVILLLIKN